MKVQSEQTPKPEVMNFFPEAPVLESGTADFKDSDDIRCSPLAERLFDISGVKSVFLSDSMVSVTRHDNVDWDTLAPRIEAEILEHLALGEPAMIADDEAPAEPAKPAESAEELETQVRQLLDARIRPAVQQDGGDIIFSHIENGIVYVQMTGSCNGCPYAAVTLKDGVEKVLKHYIPGVVSVEAV